MARKPIKYEFTADADDFQRGAKEAERSLKGIERQAERTEDALDLKPTVDDSAIDTLRRRLLLVKAQLERDIQIDPDVDVVEALRKLRTLERQLKQLDRMDVKPEVDIDRDGDLSRFTANTLPELARYLPEVATSLGRVASSSPVAAAGLSAVAVAASGVIAAVGTGAGGGLVAALVGKGAYSLLSAYDEVAKANARFDTVFGDQADTIEQWAKELGYATGAGREAVKAQAAAVQDLLVPRGFSRAKAARVTESILDRAAALAEWSGVDVASASDAITAALLGEREQLKNLGVEIKQIEVDRRVAALRSKDAYRGMNDAQLEVLATQALIEEKSVDAWTAWTHGADDAGAALDRLNAAMANFRSDAILGFGGIFAEIVSDLVGGGKALEDIDLASWIADNASQIRAAMLDIADVALVGAEAFVDLSVAGIRSFQALWPVLRATTRLLAQQAAQAQVVSGALLLMNPLTFKFGADLIKNAGNTVALADAAIAAGDAFLGFSDYAVAGLEKVRDGIGKVQTSVQELRELDRIKAQMTVQIKAGNTDEVKAAIDALTDDQIATIIAQADRESATATDKELGRLANKERKARIKALATDTERENRRLDYLARNRTATISVRYKGYDIPYYLARPDLQRTAAASRTYYPVPQVAVGRAAVPTVGTGGTVRTSTEGGLTVNFYGNLIDPDGAARAMDKAYREHRQRVGV